MSALSWQMLFIIIVLYMNGITSLSTTELEFVATSHQQPDDDHIDIGCNYINMAHVAIPTDICHHSVLYGIAHSYMYRCNNEEQYPSITTPVVELYWEHANCTGTPYINETIATDYSCEYAPHENDHCIDNQIVITLYLHDPSATETCIYDKDFLWTETQISNSCIESTQTGLYLQYLCSNDQVSINYYSDNTCDAFLYTNDTIKTNDCMDGNIFLFSCPDTETTTDSPKATQTTDDIDCDYVNYDGFARRLNVCHPAPSTGFDEAYYELQCNEPQDMESDGPVSVVWWGADGCDSDPLHRDPLTVAYDIIDYQCSTDDNETNVCSTEEVLLLQKYDHSECMKDDTQYHMIDMILNTCVKDGAGGAKRVQCDESVANVGYKILHYADEGCNELVEEESYGAIECPNNERLQFVIWCERANVLQYIEDKCQYFVQNEHLNPERKYLIHALYKCSEFMLNGGYFSNQYVCNSDKNGVEEIWYKGKRCEEENEIGRYAFDAHTNNFRCYDGLISSDDESECDQEDNILTLRWYNKDPLNDFADCMKKKGFHQDNYIITGLCIPNFANVDETTGVIYTMIKCDDHHLDWFEIGYYSDARCADKLYGIQVQTGQCFNGDIVDIKGCNSKGSTYDDYMDSSSSSSSSSDELPVVNHY